MFTHVRTVPCHSHLFSVSYCGVFLLPGISDRAVSFWIVSKNSRAWDFVLWKSRGRNQWGQSCPGSFSAKGFGVWNIILSKPVCAFRTISGCLVLSSHGVPGVTFLYIKTLVWTVCLVVSWLCRFRSRGQISQNETNYYHMTLAPVKVTTTSNKIQSIVIITFGWLCLAILMDNYCGLLRFHDDWISYDYPI